MGNRNRRAEPTTNKVKRRLSLTQAARRPSRSDLAASHSCCLRTRWSIPTVSAECSLHCPLCARKAECP